MNQIFIKTKRLIIKPISLNDVHHMFEYRAHENVARFQSFRPKTMADVEAFIKNNPFEFNTENSWFQLGVFLNQMLIGDIGIHFVGPENKQCEIGYTIGEAYQKKGYGKESVWGITNYLFKEMNKHRISASLDPKNEASIALLESLGFRKEGLFKKSVLNNGIWEDDLVYAKLNEEWDVMPSINWTDK